MTRGVLELALPDDPRPDQPNVLHALLRKRAEISGQIEYAQKKMRDLIVELNHVEATIHLFAPEAKVETLRPKPYPPRQQAFKGEMLRIVLTSLREAPEPLTTREIAIKLMVARGLNGDDQAMLTTFIRRVGACLLAQRNRGIAEPVDRTGQYNCWRLVRPAEARS